MPYVDVETLLKAVKDNAMTRFDWSEVIDVEDFEKVLTSIPAADVVKIQHGEWLECTRETLIPVEYDGNGDPILHKVIEYRCSLCNRLEGKKEPYCNCGAKMDGGNE